MVTIDDNGCMKCSCCSTDQYGIPDRHIAHVCLYYGTGFESFSHHDIDLRHHNSYCQLVATKDASSMSDSELELRSSLIRARRMELPLPAAPGFFEFESGAKFSIGSNCSEEEIGGYAEIWARICRVKKQRAAALNYSASEIISALRSEEKAQVHAAGFTQSQHNCDSSEDESTISFGNWDSAELEPRAELSGYDKAAPFIQQLHQSIHESDTAAQDYAI